jgi:hypothetical protein
VKRKKGKNRVKISFAATILVLSAITLIAYTFSFRVPSYSIPANLPPYGGLVGKYAPSDSLQVSFQNYSAIRTFNVSAVPNKQLVNLVKPSVTVHVSAVQDQILVTLLNPTLHINNTATAAVLNTGAFANLSRALSNSGLVPDREQNFALYHVNDSSNGRTKTEWITLVPDDSSVVFAEGASDARAIVLRVLSVWDGATPSILTSQNVTRMLYPVDGTNHLAFAIQNFTGEVLSSKMGVVTVDVADQRVQLTHVVRFISSNVASSQVAQVQGVYRFATDFSSWEENVKAVQSYSLKNLQGAVALVGG